MKNNSLSKLFVIVFFFSLSTIYSQENVNFVTYGPTSNPKEGDNDFVQVFFLEIDEPNIDSILVDFLMLIALVNMINLLDLNFNSEFKFSLYGGIGAYTAESIRTESPNNSDLHKGTLLKKSVNFKSKRNMMPSGLLLQLLKKLMVNWLMKNIILKLLLRVFLEMMQMCLIIRATSKNK